MRTVGRLPGMIALLLDVGKGVVPVVLFASIFYQPSAALSEPLFRVILGFSAVCGHIWTLFLGFKGGKGVATTVGVFIGLSPLVSALGLLAWLLVVLLCRYVSIGSIAMAVALPVLMIIFDKPIEYTALSIILCIFIVYKHKSNIRRVINRTEHKIGQSKK